MRKLICLLYSLALSAISIAQNYALNYNGSSQYTAIPSSVAVSQLNTFTVEAWVYWNGGGNGCIYSETVLGNDNPMFSIIPRSTDGGGIELTFRDNSTVGLTLQPANAKVTANQWVHVAVVRTSATNMKIYIDGVLKDDATFSAPASWTPNKVNIGSQWRASMTDYFGGKIDEVRVWNTARTQAEIKANMFNHTLSNSASGLVAYYRFNEGSGSSTANSCTNTSGIDGTLNNSPSWVSSPVEFSANTVQYDQSDDKMLAPLPSTATSNVTMEGWIYHNGGTGTDHVVMSNGLAGGNGYTFFINTGHTLIIVMGGVGSFNTGISVPVNQWTHYALVIGSAGFTVYENGVNRYSTSSLPNTPTGSFVLGYNNNFGGQPFDGSIDEVRIWNTARTQTEIQDNMNKEISPATPGLAAYYTFNQGIPAGDNTGLITVIDQAGTNNGTLTNFSLTGSASNYVAQSNTLAVLALQWVSFTASEKNNSVLLQWSTEQEANTSYFAVEHSIDGNQWNNIGQVKAAGSSSAVRHYSYLHTQPETGMNYYRIVETDLDGKTSYSVIKSVRIDKTVSAIQLLSNPVLNGTLLLQNNTGKLQDIALYNQAGQLLWKKQIATGLQRISLANQPKGIYFLHAADDNIRVILK